MLTGVPPRRIATRNIKLSLSRKDRKNNASNACIRKHLFLMILGANAPACGRSPQDMLIGFADKLRSNTCVPDNSTMKQRSTRSLRKEVIQPHLPIRLPCYDFTPVISPAFGSSLLAVGSLTSGITNSHGVTGGVYKTRERIHRSMLICDY